MVKLKSYVSKEYSHYDQIKDMAAEVIAFSDKHDVEIIESTQLTADSGRKLFTAICKSNNMVNEEESYCLVVINPSYFVGGAFERLELANWRYQGIIKDLKITLSLKTLEEKRKYVDQLEWLATPIKGEGSETKH